MFRRRPSSWTGLRWSPTFPRYLLSLYDIRILGQLKSTLPPKSSSFKTRPRGDLTSDTPLTEKMSRGRGLIENAIELERSAGRYACGRRVYSNHPQSPNVLPTESQESPTAWPTGIRGCPQLRSHDRENEAVGQVNQRS